jgi:hypothetical protein
MQRAFSKEKFWFRMPEDEQRWLFKFTGEKLL